MAGHEASFFTAVSTMCYRQVKCFLRMRSRVIMSFVRPFMWLFFFGVGWAASIRGDFVRTSLGGMSFMDFMAVGVTMMAVFFTSFFAGSSVIWDREFGLLKETFVSPASRKAIILGRALGDSFAAMIQGTVTFAVAMLLMEHVNMAGIPMLILVMLLTSIVHASMGSALGSLVNSVEAFQLINMTVAMPMLFLSGAVVPLYTAPTWMRTLSLLIPLTYGVDAARASVSGISMLPLWLDLTVLVGLAILLVAVSAKVFERATVSV